MSTILSSILFLSVWIIALFVLFKNANKLKKAINQGQGSFDKTNSSVRWTQMLKVAFGQSKMGARPIAAMLHLIVYIGFFVVNIELIEILIDGLFGTHRILNQVLGSLYNGFTATLEVFAALVLLAVVIFWLRRNVLRIQRFRLSEMKGWPKLDADFILYFEILLMLLFFGMNTSDMVLQSRGVAHYSEAGFFPVSALFAPLFESMTTSTLIIFERSFWWLHIIGILCFLNYLYYSKHLHIILAFPNTFFAKLGAIGQLNNMQSVTNEVKAFMDPSAAQSTDENTVASFGAKDVTDLSVLQLLNAYSCTECGRCTSVCPAHLTGKKLSPRKIMMDTRDRATALIQDKKQKSNEEKPLLDGYISREELWACTTCNACVEACPILIDPVSIILDMRRYLIMEESSGPSDLNSMMTNMENNGAPWPFSPQDRMNWTKE